MNMTGNQSLIYLDKIGGLLANNNTIAGSASMIICPPYTAIDLMSSVLFEASEGIFSDDNLSNIVDLQLGVQNINPNDEGAYTGEVSMNMINQYYGVEWVIAGHSERRSLFSESNEFINLKVKKILESGKRPILCIGETLEQREAGKTREILYSQLKDCLKEIECSDDFLIAYEPVWAIGTGKTADNGIIESAHNMILDIIGDLKCNIKNPKILYGGSVNNNNAESLSKICNLDGFLIGGASLDPQEFYNIYTKLKGE